MESLITKYKIDTSSPVTIDFKRAVEITTEVSMDLDISDDDDEEDEESEEE